jgi:uncharacterized protein YuzE
MRVVYDKSSSILSIQLKDEPSTESAELEPGVVADYNSSGEIIGIEIEDAHKFDLSKFSFETLEKAV